MIVADGYAAIATTNRTAAHMLWIADGRSRFDRCTSGLVPLDQKGTNGVLVELVQPVSLQA